MALENGLLEAKVWHKRLHPKVNDFTYSVYYLCIKLSDINSIKLPILSINQFNIFSFYEKDHWPKTGQNNELWLRELLAKESIIKADGEILLITMPRLFGYVFNPVSFWICQDKDKNIRAVLAEVRNTFGEWHNYLLFHEDQRPIQPGDILESKKMFHVSPFMHVKGDYKFKFGLSDKKVNITIDYTTEEGELLKTSVIGNRKNLTSSSLISAFFKCPLLTFKVITLIHYQALKIILKKIKYIPKPPPPIEETTK